MALLPAEVDFLGLGDGVGEGDVWSVWLFGATDESCLEGVSEEGELEDCGAAACAGRPAPVKSTHSAHTQHRLRPN